MRQLKSITLGDAAKNALKIKLLNFYLHSKTYIFQHSINHIDSHVILQKKYMMKRQTLIVSFQQINLVPSSEMLRLLRTHIHTSLNIDSTKNLFSILTFRKFPVIVLVEQCLNWHIGTTATVTVKRLEGKILKRIWNVCNEKSPNYNFEETEIKFLRCL